MVALARLDVTLYVHRLLCFSLIIYTSKQWTCVTENIFGRVIYSLLVLFFFLRSIYPSAHVFSQVLRHSVIIIEVIIIIISIIIIIQYKDHIIEIQHMWNVKAKMIPVIIGATGTISKSLRQYLSNTPGKYEMKELQKKIAIHGTACILRKVLM
jgi:hypothetical protein